MNASFEEKSVWITLFSLVATFAAYFFVAARMLSAGVMIVAPYVAVLGLTTVLLVIVIAAGHVVVAVASRPDGRDERDRLIEWRAESNSSWLLAVGVLAAIAGLTLGVGAAWIANGLLTSLFLSEVLKQVLQLVYYRRGI